MADITMCEGTGCPVKELCYRFTAPVTADRQAYFVYVPWSTADNKCSYFWSLDVKRAQETVKE